MQLMDTARLEQLIGQHQTGHPGRAQSYRTLSDWKKQLDRTHQTGNWPQSTQFERTCPTGFTLSKQDTDKHYNAIQQ
jgi:hypothetical protein